MLRTAVLVVATFYAPFAISQSVTTQLVAPPIATDSCPIDFSAQRSGGPTKMIVDSGTHLHVSQQVQLLFGNTTRHRIEQMSITVHGLSGNAHAIPIVSEPSGPATRSTRAELKLAVAAGGNGETSLRVDGITSIRTIDLNSVQYEDGSEWRASPGKTCSVMPNGFMLVDSH